MSEEKRENPYKPCKLNGQNYLYGWPVVKEGKIIVPTVSNLPGAEFLMANVLSGLSSDPAWAEEKTAVLNWLNQNPPPSTCRRATG
jgi:hypothetical protein